jgi:hypothetical protein
MSENTLSIIERIMVTASMQGERVHWQKIFAHSPEYLGKREKQLVKNLADRWGVELIGKA